ncbi:MAG: hypothetical protein DID90_2727554403 [Candidatus Nitrotoga sp. LAW]|nr:MAG: hypothetical protein DID90_2727554403 [Candidatus Nitrotoga sp. LAW]
MAIGTGAAKVWYHDPHVWRFVFARYLPALAVLSALWEIAQLPLYTLCWEAPPASIAYAVFHCTLGDVIIGVGALLAALIVTRAGALRASLESGHNAQYTAKPVLRLCLQHAGCAGRGGASVPILRLAALADDRCSCNELQFGVCDQQRAEAEPGEAVNRAHNRA